MEHDINQKDDVRIARCHLASKTFLAPKFFLPRTAHLLIGSKRKWCNKIVMTKSSIRILINFLYLEHSVRFMVLKPHSEKADVDF